MAALNRGTLKFPNNIGYVNANDFANKKIRIGVKNTRENYNKRDSNARRTLGYVTFSAKRLTSVGKVNRLESTER